MEPERKRDPPAPLRRIGVVGDVHQEDERLEAVLRHFDARGVDRVICTGDVVDGLGSAAKAIRILVDHRVDTVAGNHDRWILSGSFRDLPDALPSEHLSHDERRWLAGLPKTRTYQTVLGQLLLCHGLGENDMRGLKPDDEGYALEQNDDLRRVLEHRTLRVVVGGHTHRRMVRGIDAISFLNAGTLLRSHDPTCLLLDCERQTAQFFDLSAPDRALPSGPEIAIVFR